MIRKKIVHIVPTFELGGVQTGILYSLVELNKEFDYRVLVIGKTDGEWLKSISPQIQQYIMKTGTDNMIIGNLRAYKILKKIAPQVLICSLWKSVALASVYKLLNPLVYFFGFYHNAFPHHFLGNLFLKLMSAIQNSALADSNETKLFLEKKYNLAQVNVIPYNFTFAGKDFKRRQLDPTAIRMAYFGRLIPDKGIDRDIEFCRLCKEAGLPFTFHLYGDGAEGSSKYNYSKLIKKYKLENEVAIKKIIPSNIVLEKMYQYDFLLQLSNMEGMALAVVEAMNSGLVPIVTPVGEISKYSQDGVNAIWLNPGFDSNLNQLIDKVKKVIAQPEVYTSLSYAASNTFNNYKKYSETMIEAINNSLNNYGR